MMRVMSARRPVRRRVKCQACRQRRVCKLLPTVDYYTEKPDGGKAYFCRPCQSAW